MKCQYQTYTTKHFLKTKSKQTHYIWQQFWIPHKNKMESDSEIGSESDEWPVDETDHVHEAEKTVCNYNQISIENALILNKQMRLNLGKVKAELERLLSTCQKKYKQNELLMEEMNAAKNAPKLYATYYFCGYPYFKDRKGGGPPKSVEYLRRTEKECELFPLDLEKRSVWMPRDKVELIQGVKKQVIQYLQMKNRMRIRQTAAKRCANELSARIQNESDALENMHLKELLKKTEKTDFQINWSNISADNLQERHSPNECMAMWFGYLMPTLNRKAWTPAEEDKLLNAAIKFSAQNWTEIAKAVENRSVYQCFVHYQTHFNNKSLPKNVRWTPEQDRELVACVEKYRIGNVIPWTKVMEKCPGRSKVQIYNRYMFTLNPEINRAPFTVEEDCILMAAIKEYGSNYREFPTNLLPGRSMKQIRSRYNNVLKHVNVREHWTEEHDKKLMKLVEQHGTTDWVKIADEMVSHSRTSCRQRYTTIQKFLEKNPTKTIADVPRRKRAFSTNVTTDNWMETIIEAKHLESIEMDDVGQSNTSTQTKTISKQKRPNNTVAKPPMYNTHYYDFLKYSHNFKLGETITGSDSLYENVQIACQLLQAPTLPRQMDISDPSFSRYVIMRNNVKKAQLEPELLHSLNQLVKNDFAFPVNLNTILGMRALTVMFEGNDKKKTAEKQQLVKTEAKNDEHDALNLFKMRFRSIFKHTAAIAKMKRSFTSVSLRLRCQKRQHENSEMTQPPSFGLDENETEQDEHSDGPSRKRHRAIAIREDISIDSNPNDTDTCDPLQSSQASTSSEFAALRYRVETSERVQKIQIQPYTASESGTDTDADCIPTNFVIWTPIRCDDEATTSTTIQPYQPHQ